MKRKLKNFAAILATATIMVGAVPNSIWAVDANSITNVSGNKITVEKILAVRDGATVPNVSFSYTLEGGTVQTGSSSSLAIYSGSDTTKITGGLPKVKIGASGSETGAGQTNTISYSNTDSYDETTDTRMTISGYKSVTKNITLDFEGITFNEPGVYRYKLTEDTTAKTGVTFDVNKDGTAGTGNGVRTIDVYVENAENAVEGKYPLYIAGYIIYEGEVTGQPANTASEYPTASATNTTPNNNAQVSDTVIDSATKSDCYINKYTTYDLKVTKNVSGNQASRDKYFKVNVKFTGLPSTTYAVDISGAVASPEITPATDSTYTSMSNPTTITTNNDGKVDQDFYLQHGQYVTVKGVPENISYTVEETAEDYSPSKTVATGTGKDSDIDTTNSTASKVIDTKIEGDADVTFTNSRSGILPTGIIISMAPAIGFIAVSLAALFAFIVGAKKRKAELDEE